MNGEGARAPRAEEIREVVPVTIQILVDLKSKDPTALTAVEAIRHLLGYGERLHDLRRRQLHELVLRAPSGGPGASAHRDPDSLGRSLSAYLEGSVVFWNPNKQRAWARSSEDHCSSPWEAVGTQRREGSFGNPGLEEPVYDHVLLWPRGQGSEPADLAAALRPWEVLAYGRGELYSLLWSGTEEERRSWTASVAVSRSRTEGLLVNPHFQDHRIVRGAVPLPLWS